MIDLEEGENVLMEVHRHPFVMVKTAVALVLALFIPVAFLVAVGTLSSLFDAEAIRNATPLALFLYSAWLLALWMFFFIDWTDYYLDLWYVTDRRIIDVEQKGFFRREVISFRYDNIQDITIDTEGIIQTMLKFGDIKIQTASENRMIFLRDARRPDRVKNFILGLHHSAMDTRTVRLAPDAPNEKE